MKNPLRAIDLLLSLLAETLTGQRIQQIRCLFYLEILKKMLYLFTYGTLKENGCAAHLLNGAQFIGEATTLPNFQLYSAGWYPMMVLCENGHSIEGELWKIPEILILTLDRYEGSSYVRAQINLLEPFDKIPVVAYLYNNSVQGLVKIGTKWNNA